MSKTTKPNLKAGPVARARAIFAKMPRARRKDVLAACATAGINPATAATYLQLWKHGVRGPAKQRQRTA
jgi:hypothetical protein